MNLKSEPNFITSEEAYKAKRSILPVENHILFDDLTFTIDPPTSTDIEDALSVRKIGDNYEVGVHISDVTAFKELFNREETVRRGTSIYLPHRTIHMMPEEVVQLCALKPKQDRLVFTVFMEIDPKGNILNHRF